MNQNSPKIPGRFGHGEVGFVCNARHVDAKLAGTTDLSDQDYANFLSASGRLPDLNGAPVSAWVLARLAALCGPRFPFAYEQVCGSDGDNYWISFLSFATEGSVRPTGKLNVQGGRSTVALYASAAPPHTPEQLRDAFSTALLSFPGNVRRCRLIVVYTLIDDKDHWRYIPYALGWDGTQYIYQNSPQHAIVPEDYE